MQFVCVLGKREDRAKGGDSDPSRGLPWRMLEGLRASSPAVDHGIRARPKVDSINRMVISYVNFEENEFRIHHRFLSRT
jgi:hypothetical protein